MDYPTAAFLAMIALTGLVAVIIYRVPLRKTAKNDTHPQHNNDNKLLLAELTKIRELMELQVELQRQLLAATNALSSLQVPSSSPESIESFNSFSPRKAKDSPKAQRVRDWLLEHQNTDLSNVAIGKLLGVSHTLVNQVRKQ